MKKFICTALSLLVLLSTVSCTGKSTDAVGQQPAGSGGSNKQQAGTAGNKIVNIALSENPIDLDPLNQLNVPGNAQVNLCMEPLVWYDGKGGFEPLLAESWEHNPEGTEWTIKVRQGIKFHNGEELNADDVACTFQRILDNKSSLFNPLTYWTALESYEVADASTFKFKLSEPSATTLMNLYYTPIIPNEAYTEFGDKLWNDQMMYGTGPWIFDTWVDGQYCHFTKNPDYWNKENYDSYYDEVYLRYILEASTAVASHLAGDIQAYIASGGINPDMQPLYKGSESKIDIDKMDSGAYMYIGFSFKDGSPFKDINVRKAFNYAIDRQSIIDNILGSGKVPNGILLDTCAGYNPNLQGYTYDPQQAQQFLANSSYAGEEIKLVCNTSALKGESILLSVSEMLNSIGFNSSVSVVESATLADMRKTGTYDTFMVANMFGANDPMQTLTLRILQDGHHSFYENTELNELIKASNREMDLEKRKAFLQQIAAVMDTENAPHTALAQLELTYALDKGVTGLDLYKDGWFNLKYVNFDESQAK